MNDEYEIASQKIFFEIWKQATRTAERQMHRAMEKTTGVDVPLFRVELHDDIIHLRAVVAFKAFQRKGMR